jgi:hypothetical protein
LVLARPEDGVSFSLYGSSQRLSQLKKRTTQHNTHYDSSSDYHDELVFVVFVVVVPTIVSSDWFDLGGCLDTIGGWIYQ